MTDGTNSSVADPEVKEEVVVATDSPAADSPATEPVSEVKSDEPEAVNYEQRFKDTQAAFTKSQQELAELRKKLETDKSADVEKQIKEIQDRMADPEFLQARLLEAQRKREEDESLTPEQKELRELKKQQGFIFNQMKVRNALDVFEDLKESDEFYDEYKDQIAEAITANPRLKEMVLDDPANGYKFAKGLFIDKYLSGKETRMKEKVEEENRKKVEDARSKKTTMNTGTGASATIVKTNKTTADLYDEFMANQGKK